MSWARSCFPFPTQKKAIKLFRYSYENRLEFWIRKHVHFPRQETVDKTVFHYEDYDVVFRLCTWLSFGTICIAVCSPSGELFCFNYDDL